MRPHKLIWVSLISAIVLAGCARQTAMPIEAMPTEESTSQPAPTPLPVGGTVVADGELASPYPSLALGFEVSGEVLTITVKPGDAVQAGDVLALLDETELRQAVGDAQRALERAITDRERARQTWERDLADAEQALAQAERALTTARLQYSDTAVEEARINLERALQAEADAAEEYNKAINRTWEPDDWHEVYHDNLQRAIEDRQLAAMRLADAEAEHRVAALDLETCEEDVAEAGRALAALQEGTDPQYGRAVEDAQAELTQAQEDLTHARLTAPWDSIVLAVDVTPGATVGASTPVVTLLDVGDGLRFVTQNLSEQHIAAIYPGQRAVVTLRTFAETPLEGTVEAVIPQENEAADTDARFTVRIRLPGSADLRLLPGLTGRVEIYTGE